MGGTCSMRVTREMHTKFLSESLKGRDDLEDLGVDERVI